LILLHVIESLSPSVPTEFIQPEVFETMEAENQQGAERRIARLAAAARRSSVKVKTMLLAGEPARQISRGRHLPIQQRGIPILIPSTACA
jgi:hypothetical protein